MTETFVSFIEFLFIYFHFIYYFLIIYRLILMIFACLWFLWWCWFTFYLFHFHLFYLFTFFCMFFQTNLYIIWNSYENYTTHVIHQFFYFCLTIVYINILFFHLNIIFSLFFSFIASKNILNVFHSERKKRVVYRYFHFYFTLT